MDHDRLQIFLDWMERSPLSTLEIADGDFSLRLVRATPSPGGVAAVAGQDDFSEDVVKAPSFGVIHLTPSPQARTFVSEGADVEAGQTLALIEAMKVFSPITAENAGKVAAILIEDGAEIAAGEALFRIVKRDV